MRNSIKSIVLISFLLTGINAFPQSNLRAIGKIATQKKSEEPARITSVENTHISLSKPTANTGKNDTVYCLQTAKRHGWFEPLGLLTKDQARHQAKSLMLTGRNAKGHWTKMESIDARGNHVPSGMHPYIIKIGNEKDSLVNGEWNRKLPETCIFEFIPDPTGDNIIQERAYDKNYNLVYSYSRTPIGSNQFIGSYRDINGLPAEMRADQGYKYGTLVLITQDEAGNDMRVEYIDSQRRNKPNADGAYAEMFEYDNQGNLRIQYSVDSLGNKIKDKWGNCAILHEFDKNHLPLTSTYADEFLKPMRMMDSAAQEMRGTMTTLRAYDDYFRISHYEFLTPDGEPDANIYGCHKICMEYDDYGNILSSTGYDKFGEQATQNESGTSKYLYKYDANGNVILGEFLDKYNNPVSTPGFLCRIEKEYNKENELRAERCWIIKDGNLKLDYLYEIKELPTYDEMKLIFGDGSSNTERYDKKKRLIYDAYFNEDGTRGLNSDGTWSYKETEYLEVSPGKTKSITRFYGPDEKLAGSDKLDFNYEIALTDSVTHRTSYLQYKDDFLVNTFSKTFNDDFSVIIGQEDNNRFGEVTRAGGISGVRHYGAKVKWTPFSQISNIACTDEFDEPDYLTSADDLIYYYMRNTAEGTAYMTTENEVISHRRQQTLRDELPKVMSVEIIDSIAYKYGFRNNDVILTYGDFAAGIKDIPSFFKFRRDWALASILEADKPSRMVVFRIDDASNDRYGLVELDNLYGTPSELGIISHIRYLTQKQTERILSSIETEQSKENPLITEADLSFKRLSPGDNYVILAFTDLYRTYRNKPYAMEVLDPAIMLASCVKDLDLYWSLEKGEDSEDFTSMLEYRKPDAPRYPIMDFFFTTDTRRVKPIHLKEKGVYTNFFDTYISDEDYSRLSHVKRIAFQSLDSIKSKPSSFKRKDLIGRWELSTTDSTGNARPKGHLNFFKNGKCEGKIKFLGFIGNTEEKAIFEVERDYAGQWQLKDSLLRITPDKELNINLNCIDIIGADEEIKNVSLDLLNVYCNAEENKEATWNEMVFMEMPWRNEMFIHSIDQDRLSIDNGDREPTVLLKVNPKELKESGNKDRRKSAKKNNNGRIDPELIGTWTTSIPDLPDSFVSLTLNKDESSQLNIKASSEQDFDNDKSLIYTISITGNGSWESDGNTLLLHYDPATLIIEADCQISGMSEEEAEEIKSMVLREFDSEKEEIALGMLYAGGFKEPLPISDISKDSVMINHQKWIRL